MDLNSIKLKVEDMDKSNQVEILRILKKNNLQINENKNGVFINLSTLDEKIITDISKYITYYENQESKLNEQEKIKDTLKETLIEE